MKTIKFKKRKGYTTVSTRLSYSEMIRFRRLQKKLKLNPSHLIKTMMAILEVKLLGKEIES